MNLFVLAALIFSEMLSAFLIYRLLSSKRNWFEKLVYCVVLLIPFVGPLVYFFLSEEVPPQPPLLRNEGPRGAYTHNMLAIQESIKAATNAPPEIQRDISSDNGEMCHPVQEKTDK